MHACPLRVDLEHRACQQRWEHGGQRGDSHWELGVPKRQPERHHHASGLEGDDPHRQLPPPVQVGYCRREGVFNLVEKRQQTLRADASIGVFKTMKGGPCDGRMVHRICPPHDQDEVPSNQPLGASRDAPAPRTPVSPPQGQPGRARSLFVRIHGNLQSGSPSRSRRHPENQRAGNVCVRQTDREWLFGDTPFLAESPGKHPGKQALSASMPSAGGQLGPTPSAHHACTRARITRQVKEERHPPSVCPTSTHLASRSANCPFAPKSLSKTSVG